MSVDSSRRASGAVVENLILDASGVGGNAHSAPQGMGVGVSSLTSAQSSTDVGGYAFKYLGIKYILKIKENGEMDVFRYTGKGALKKQLHYFARISTSGKNLEFCQRRAFKSRKSIKITSLPELTRQAITSLLESLKEEGTKGVFRISQFCEDEVKLNQSVAVFTSDDSKPSLWRAFKAQPLKALFYILPMRFLALLAFVCTLGYWKPSSP